MSITAWVLFCLLYLGLLYGIWELRRLLRGWPPKWMAWLVSLMFLAALLWLGFHTPRPWLR